MLTFLSSPKFFLYFVGLCSSTKGLDRLEVPLAIPKMTHKVPVCNLFVQSP